MKSVHEHISTPVKYLCCYDLGTRVVQSPNITLEVRENLKIAAEVQDPKDRSRGTENPEDRKDQKDAKRSY